MFKKINKQIVKKKKKSIHTELTTIGYEIRKIPNTSTYYDILLIYSQANQTKFDFETRYFQLILVSR